MYAIILIGNHQYKVFIGTILSIFNLKFNINDCFFINKVLLLYLNKRYYFNDDFLSRRVFLLCRVKNKFYKKNVFLKMKRRKHNLKIKKKKTFYSEIIIEKFFINFLI